MMRPRWFWRWLIRINWHFAVPLQMATVDRMMRELMIPAISDELYGRNPLWDRLNKS